MKTLLVGLLLGLCAGAIAAWQVGGALGDGVLLGFAVGSLLSFTGAWVQHRTPAERPQQAMAAFVAFFLVKLMLLALGGIVLRVWEPAASMFDWRAYLVAFGAGVLWIVGLCTAREMTQFREVRAS